jgi:shikimate dehydrogenase
VTPVKPFKLYGIFGAPLAHTLSPAMQEAAFAALGLKAYYLVLEMDLNRFRQVMRNLSRLVLDGFNVTVPYKKEVLPYLDDLTPEARAVGAVNTVFRRGKKWMGANTDVTGFLTSLRMEGSFQIPGKKILVLGAGGSARAVIYGLAEKAAQSILVANRHNERAQEIVRSIRSLFPRTYYEAISLQRKRLAEVLEDVHLVVNATSVGLRPGDPSIIPSSLIPKAKLGRRMLFFDLIYRPLCTRFLHHAKVQGHKTLHGLGMLLFQGARSFEYWTKKKASISVMRQALREALQQNH